MCVSQHIFCCFCHGNFEYCTRLTVKSVIHPLVDLPSVLALKTNNFSLDCVYSCLDSGRKTGRLKKIRPLAALVLIFSCIYICTSVACHENQFSGNHLAVTLWRTRTWKIEGKDGKKWKKRMSVSHLNERKGKKEKKKTYWWCEFRINELAKFSGHNNADIQANFQLHTDLSLNTFILKKKLQNWSKCSDFKETSRSNLVSVVYVTKAKKKKNQSQRTMTWSLCVHVDNCFLCVCVVLTHTTKHTES